MFHQQVYIFNLKGTQLAFYKQFYDCEIETYLSIGDCTLTPFLCLLFVLMVFLALLCYVNFYLIHLLPSL